MAVDLAKTLAAGEADFSERGVDGCGIHRHAGGDRIMAQVLAAVPTAGLDAVLVAVELVLESGVVSAEHVINVLGRLNAAPLPGRVHTTLLLNQPPQANSGRYDGLRRLNDTAHESVDTQAQAESGAKQESGHEA